LDGLEDDPMLQIHGYSITYRIATGKQQGRKVFTLQTIAPVAEQGLASGCASNVAGFSLHAGVMSNALNYQGQSQFKWLSPKITRATILNNGKAIKNSQSAKPMLLTFPRLKAR
jgi:hypothetical protein